jgi:hypothetical protein
MIRFLLPCCLALTTFWTIGTQRAVAAIVVDFEELSLAPNSYFDGYGETAISGSWVSQGVEFNTNPWGPGWSYSNVSDTSTPGHLNAYAAFTGTGFGGTGIYALATSFVPNSAYINLPSSHWAQSMRITNATYTALSMRDGDSFAKKFGGETGNDEDFLRLIVTGFSETNATGSAVAQTELMLADYRFADNSLDYILDEWAFLDLTSFTSARSLGFALVSSDNGAFGMNTPAFFAMDHLALTAATAVPEPSFAIVLSLAGTMITTVRYRRSRVRKFLVANA